MMKATIIAALLTTMCGALLAEQAPQRFTLSREISLDLKGRNPLIDAQGFATVATQSARRIKDRSLSEDEFLKVAAEEGVVVLDARSADRYAMRHIAGAVNLPFTDFSASTLAGVIPTKETKVLIYCNNNFEGDQVAFMTKVGTTSLNLHTASSLMSYGYTNVYQLGPLLRVDKTKIPFEGTAVLKKPVSEE